MMRVAFVGLAQEQQQRLLNLLTELLSSKSDNARLLAVQYAQSAFPSTHVGSRFLLLLAQGDARDDVRVEAQRGLRLQADIQDETSPGQIPTLAPPDVAAWLSLCHPGVCEGLTLRKRTADRQPSWRGLTLPYTAPVMQAVLQYTFKCLQVAAGLTIQEETEAAPVTTQDRHRELVLLSQWGNQHLELMHQVADITSVCLVRGPWVHCIDHLHCF
jgi:hypothetical protein